MKKTAKLLALLLALLMTIACFASCEGGDSKDDSDNDNDGGNSNKTAGTTQNEDNDNEDEESENTSLDSVAHVHTYVNGICVDCGESDPDYVEPLPELESIKISSLNHTSTSIANIAQKATTIAPAVLKTYDGNISKADQKDKYSFTPDITGYYRFDFDNMKASTEVYLCVYNDLDERLTKSFCGGNGSGETLKLTGGKTYSIQVWEYSAGQGYGSVILGSYTLNIWSAKPTVDVNSYTQISDSIEFEEQRNYYTFTPSITGFYRFDFSNMKASTDVYLCVYDDLGECLTKSFCGGNGSGETLKLTEGKTYSIQVWEYTAGQGYGSVILGSYTLNIWSAKPTVDVNSYTQISDSIEFAEQRNYYSFSPSITGLYRFEFTNMKASTSVSLRIYDDLDNLIVDSVCSSNGSGKTIQLSAGKAYRVLVREAGLDSYTSTTITGSYTMNIWNAKPVVDVTSKVQITDSIQYQGQENVYNFTADVAGDQTIKITNLNADVSLKIYVYNNLDEKVTYDTSFQNNEYLSLNGLEVGTNYRIVVCQYEGVAPYTLTIE